MRKNWFTTVGGIMAGFALIPIAIGTYAHDAGVHIQMPSWLYLGCIILGTLGPVVIGVGAQGQDQSPVNPDQIKQAIQEHLAAQGIVQQTPAPAQDAKK
jgi:hypothetical protein